MKMTNCLGVYLICCGDVAGTSRQIKEGGFPCCVMYVATNSCFEMQGLINEKSVEL